MSKKGITEHGGFTLIYAVLVVIGILVVLPLIVRILFSGGGEERAVRVSFASLEKTVIELVSPRSIFETETQPLVIPRGFAIVAFNALDPDVQNACTGETVIRPVSCNLTETCLCLYRSDYPEDVGKEKNPPLDCKFFSSAVVLIAPGDNMELELPKGWNLGAQDGTASINQVNKENPFRRYSDTKYENFLLYGSCLPMGVRVGQVFWGNQMAYIEKFSAPDGKNYVFIAKDSVFTKLRKKNLGRIVLGAG